MSTTTNYNLEKPVIGSVGWGEEVNANFDTIDTQLKANSDATAAKVPTSRTVNSKALTSDVVLTTADVADSADKRYCTDAQKTVIGNTSNTNTGDQSDATLTVTDVTTNNVSATKHGFFPKLPSVSDGKNYGIKDGAVAEIVAGGASVVRGTFADAQLNATAGILSITHSLGLSAPYTVDCTIFNNTPVKILPDNVQNFSANALDVDLTSYVRASIGVCTMTIASPCVVTRTAHGYLDDQAIMFSTTGALPTGLTAGQVYYVNYIDANTFNVATAADGANINTSGSQSGVHTLYTYTPLTGNWSYAI